MDRKSKFNWAPVAQFPSSTSPPLRQIGSGEASVTTRFKDRVASSGMASSMKPRERNCGGLPRGVFGMSNEGSNATDPLFQQHVETPCRWNGFCDNGPITYDSPLSGFGSRREFSSVLPPVAPLSTTFRFGRENAFLSAEATGYKFGSSATIKNPIKKGDCTAHGETWFTQCSGPTFATKVAESAFGFPAGEKETGKDFSIGSSINVSSQRSPRRMMANLSLGNQSAMHSRHWAGHSVCPENLVTKPNIPSNMSGCASAMSSEETTADRAKKAAFFGKNSLKYYDAPHQVLAHPSMYVANEGVKMEIPTNAMYPVAVPTLGAHLKPKKEMFAPSMGWATGSGRKSAFVFGAKGSAPPPPEKKTTLRPLSSGSSVRASTVRSPNGFGSASHGTQIPICKDRFQSQMLHRFQPIFKATTERSEEQNGTSTLGRLPNDEPGIRGPVVRPCIVFGSEPPASPPLSQKANAKEIMRAPGDHNNNRMASSVSTSAISFVETAHGRLRREQRGIGRKDLQAAKKYGARVRGRPRPNGDTTSMYTYGDIVYITNDVSGEEVTSYAIPIVLEKVNVPPAIRRQHNEAVRDIKRHNHRWKSNTVIIVDTSGSMKKCDVWGTKTRLDAVWLSLALDFIAQRIESGAAGVWDVVSVVSLGPTGEIIVEEMPTTWVLYNYVVDLYNNRTFKPKGHGMYMPSIDVAQFLLNQNKNSSCAMGLLLLSDGAPSDHMTETRHGMTRDEIFNDSRARIIDCVEELAKKFGRRLTFSAIGIGSSDDFVTLRRMVDAASDYGVHASFELPSRSSSGIGEAFSSVATSITSTQTELTDLSTLHQREVRSVLRESRRLASTHITHVNEEEFHIYKPGRIRRKVYHEWFEGRLRKWAFKDAPLQDHRAKYIAFSKGIFGEGAERFAYRFFELASDARTIVGRPLVAKESRHVIEHGGEFRREFVKRFCETQQLARRIAKEFNAKLESMNVDKRTPRVDVLDCSIYYLKDNNLGELATLVEPRIDQNKWHKWNANNGYVEGMQAAPNLSEAALQETEDLLKTMDLGAIEEGSEDDEEDSESESQPTSSNNKVSSMFSQSEVAQAFSHFSYWATGRKRLICDLQGVFDEKANILRLSDPVIHYYNQHNETRQNVHGMTDRGRKGIRMFWATHECSRLCFMCTNGFKKSNLRGRTDNHSNLRR